MAGARTYEVLKLVDGEYQPLFKGVFVEVRNPKDEIVVSREPILYPSWKVRVFVQTGSHSKIQEKHLVGHPSRQDTLTSFLDIEDARVIAIEINYKAERINLDEL